MITRHDICACIAEVLPGFDTAALRDDQVFREAGIDSLDHINVLLAVEERHGLAIPDAQARACNSIAAILAFAALQPA